MCTLDASGIQDGGRIGSHQRYEIDTRGRIALANAAIIESDRTISLREDGATAVPHIRGIAEAHDKQERFAGALFVPIYSGALIFNEGHRASRDDKRFPSRDREEAM